MLEPHRQFFGDAEYPFLISPDLVIELERKAGAGIGSISRRLYAGDHYFAELTEIIRLALIGGGMDAKDAAALVETYAPRLSVTALYETALAPVDLLIFGSVQRVATEDAE